jgi:hypothetical protein
MKFASKASVVAAAVLLIATAAVAGTNVVGAWKGKVEMDLSSLPKAQNAQQQQMMDKMMAQVKKMVINLTLKGNKTFTMSAVAAPPDGKTHTMTGSWSQKGNKITMVGKTEDGKPATDKDKTQTLTVNPNGKSMSLDMPGGGGQGKLVFTR